MKAGSPLNYEGDFLNFHSVNFFASGARCGDLGTPKHQQGPEGLRILGDCRSKARLEAETFLLSGQGLISWLFLWGRVEKLLQYIYYILQNFQGWPATPAPRWKPPTSLVRHGNAWDGFSKSPWLAVYQLYSELLLGFHES